MKTQSKLEKIISSVKDAGKKSLKATKDFLKDNYQSIVLGTAFAVGGAGGAYVLDKVMVGDVYGMKLEIKHNTNVGGITREAIVILDNDSNSPYLESPPGPVLINYAKNSNNEKLKNITINSQNTEVVKDYLEGRSVPIGTPQNIRLRFLDNTNCEKRNLTLREDPNTPNADPNIYDAWELTAGGTGYGGIPLPNITNPEPQRKWLFRSDNYADINFDGKVNNQDLGKLAPYWKTTGHGPQDNWANFADITRDGIVDEGDLACLAEQWLWGSNDPNTW